MNKTTTLLAAALLGAFTLPVLAQAPATPNTSRIDARQVRQQERIDQGVKSGQLTQKEAARLDKGQERIEKMETRAKADGKVTAKERTGIERAQDRQSRQIAKQKHDGQHAKK